MALTGGDPKTVTKHEDRLIGIATVPDECQQQRAATFKVKVSPSGDGAVLFENSLCAVSRARGAGCLGRGRSPPSWGPEAMPPRGRPCNGPPARPATSPGRGAAPAPGNVASCPRSRPPIKLRSEPTGRRAVIRGAPS